MSYWFDEKSQDSSSKIRAKGHGSANPSFNQSQSASDTMLSPTRKSNYFTSVSEAQKVYPQYKQSSQTSLYNQSEAVRSSSSNRSGGKKYSAGATVLSTAKKNDAAQDRIAELKHHVNDEQISSWFAKQDAGRSYKEMKRNQQQASEEEILAKQDLHKIRKIKLKDLLNKEFQQQENELASKGLAILSPND